MMTQKEKLIELFIKCLDEKSVVTTEQFADYLIDNGVIVADVQCIDAKNRPLITKVLGYPINDVLEFMRAKEEGRAVILPFKIGDTVWDNDFGRPCSYEVTGFDIGTTYDEEHKELFVFYGNYSCSAYCPVSCIGKTVFYTREEAEQKLKERDNG